MNTELSAEFERVEQLFHQNRSDETFRFLASHFRQQKMFAELFEVLKVQIRTEMGLPAFTSIDNDDLSISKQRELEDRLLAACQEVGSLLISAGNIELAWQYLQPLPDRHAIQNAIESVDIDENNVTQVIDIALCQWAAPTFGYQLLLEHQGTCNGITFFDTQIAFQAPKIRNSLANVLIDHIYRELAENVHHCIAEKEGKVGPVISLMSLIQDRDWLFDNCGHHLDVTHLASAVRIGKYCDSNSSLVASLELCKYGIRLDEQLVYPDEPPFESTFDDHEKYYQAILNIDRPSSLEHFRSKRAAANTPESIETCTAILVELLSRSEFSTEAIETTIDYFSSQNQPAEMGTLLSLAKTKSDYDLILDFFKSENNLLGFAMAGAKQKQLEK